ncbi:hypothetical protein PSPO01_15724 [Paraphaeosphaeria sporulosa]
MTIVQRVQRNTQSLARLPLESTSQPVGAPWPLVICPYVVAEASAEHLHVEVLLERLQVGQVDDHDLPEACRQETRDDLRLVPLRLGLMVAGYRHNVSVDDEEVTVLQ